MTLGARAEGGPRRGAPEHAGAEDHELAGGTPGAPPEQDSLAPELVQQQARADDHGQAPGDLRHAREHGRVPSLVLDGLEADRGDLALDEGAEVLGTRRGQAPEGEHDLPGGSSA